MMYSLTQNIDKLSEKENKRGLWLDERVKLQEFLWQIYGVVLENPGISDDIFKTLAVMMKIGVYSLKDMSDFLTLAGKKDIDFNRINNAVCACKPIDYILASFY